MKNLRKQTQKALFTGTLIAGAIGLAACQPKAKKNNDYKGQPPVVETDNSKDEIARTQYLERNGELLTTMHCTSPDSCDQTSRLETTLTAFIAALGDHLGRPELLTKIEGLTAQLKSIDEKLEMLAASEKRAIDAPERIDTIDSENAALAPIISDLEANIEAIQSALINDPENSDLRDQRILDEADLSVARADRKILTDERDELNSLIGGTAKRHADTADLSLRQKETAGSMSQQSKALAEISVELERVRQIVMALPDSSRAEVTELPSMPWFNEVFALAAH